MAVATAIAIGGLAITAATTTNSFIQAGKQKNKQREAEAKAEAAMAEARKKLSINYTDELAIKKEPYELQREAMLSQGAQAIQAGVESERGAAVTAGKVQMAQNEAQANIRTTMGAELDDIQKQQIAEQSRLRDLGVQLDLGEVEGQQMIAQNAEQASAAAKAQGIQGVSSTVQQGFNMLPLYFKDKPAEPAAPPLDLVNTAAQSKASDRFSNYGPQVNAGITGPMGLDWNPRKNPYGPQLPQPGSPYGPMGINFSGVGYNY